MVSVAQKVFCIDQYYVAHMVVELYVISFVKKKKKNLDNNLVLFNYNDEAFVTLYQNLKLECNSL